MKKATMLVSSFIVTTALAMPTVVSANDLHIANETQTNLSFMINNACSSDFAVVQARTIGMIPADAVNRACEYSPSNCTIAMHASDDCSGQLIGKFALDTSNGVTGVAANAQGYSISGNGFNLFVEGPTLKATR